MPIEYFYVCHFPTRLAFFILLKRNPFVLLSRRLCRALPFITYGDNEIVEFMRTSILPLMLFFISFVMMLD